MKGILIDAEAREVREVELKTKGIDEMHSLLKCTVFTSAGASKNRDTLYVDDEGLLRSGEQPGFVFQRWHLDPLVGNGLILGCDSEGESVDAKTDLDWVQENVMFGTIPLR